MVDCEVIPRGVAGMAARPESAQPPEVLVDNGDARGVQVDAVPAAMASKLGP